MDRIEHFKSCFIYDQDTGVLTWRRRPLEHFKNSRGCNTWNTKFAGKVAGSKDADGYLVVKIDFKSHRVHRVIWEMCNGPIPSGKKIDHEDHDRENNRLSNLRLTDAACSGMRGMASGKHT
ncbi:homing endonuclease [Pectobacterium phage vB_PcaM_P7_Pc]|nr:homing endonuclease [Pectobacterium phage vB_PcaM_P7_Pc]